MADVSEMFERYFFLAVNRNNETHERKKERMHLKSELRKIHTVTVNNKFNGKVLWNVKQEPGAYYVYTLLSQEGAVLYVGVSQFPTREIMNHVGKIVFDSVLVVNQGRNDAMQHEKKKIVNLILPPMNGTNTLIKRRQN